jgi:hypothetical protein
VAAMLQRYMPQDTVTRVELRQMLNKVSMKPNDDPRVIFEQISTIENRYTTATQTIETEDLIAVIGCCCEGLPSCPNMRTAVAWPECHVT